MFGSGKPSCVSGRWVFDLGEPKCVRRKTVIPRTKVFNVILWDDLGILGLSAILWRCSLTVCTLCLA